jgi:predicted HAD superfamily Cof-like phosphohydrolase
MNLSKLTASLFEHLYQDIVEFRQTFDLPVEQPESLDQAADTLHTSLAIEELTELADAKDKVEQADAIVDTVYVLMGRLVHLGHKTPDSQPGISYLIDLLLNVAANRTIDFVSCWDEVHSSNMSKVCRNRQEYDETADFYAQQGIKLVPVTKGNYIIAKCAEDVINQDKTIRQGKVLKSVYYRPANLDRLIRS